MASDTAWPGGRDRMRIDKTLERTRRTKALREGWPLRTDQKRAAARVSDNEDA